MRTIRYWKWGYLKKNMEIELQEDLTKKRNWENCWKPVVFLINEIIYLRKSSGKILLFWSENSKYQTFEFFNQKQRILFDYFYYHFWNIFPEKYPSGITICYNNFFPFQGGVSLCSSPPPLGAFESLNSLLAYKLSGNSISLFFLAWNLILK